MRFCVVDTVVSDTAPKILENLVAAGLVTHELIGDPARLSGESAALAALCARVSGAVYRLGAFHYAFRLEAGDLGGALAGADPGGWGEALAADLAADLGEEAVWVTAADLVADVEADLDSRQVTFLRAAGGALAAAFADAPDLQAVVNAGMTARIAEAAAQAAGEAVAAAAREAGAGAAAVAASLDALATRVEALEAGLESRVAAALAGAGAQEDAAAATAALAERVADDVMRRMGETVAEVADAAAGKAAAAAASSADLGFERLIGTMELLVSRMSEQAARASEQASRQDALASGIAAVEFGLEALERAAREQAAEREAGQSAALQAFEARLGLALAEFLAQVGERSAASGQAARVVEIGRTSPPLAAPPAEEAEGVAPAPVYAGPLARAVQVG
jgi:hypothetical protein